jgi:hypothetical protein
VKPVPDTVTELPTGPCVGAAALSAGVVIVIAAVPVAAELASVAIALPVVVEAGTVKAHTNPPPAVVVIVEPTNVPELQEVGVWAPTLGRVMETVPP